MLFFFFFFFQAEDGIRDADVTGVQTCALPIYLVPAHEEVLVALHHFPEKTLIGVRNAIALEGFREGQLQRPLARRMPLSRPWSLVRIFSAMPSSGCRRMINLLLARCFWSESKM